MAGHSTEKYRKIYITLLVLFVISVLGPELAEILHLEGAIRMALVLSTAFGIALVKAYMVAAHFMHLKVEKVYAPYILASCLAMIFVFFFGTATDVMKADGHNWTKEYVEPEPKESHGHGDHGDAHGDHGDHDHH
ncbi:hypothetical protein MLD52_02010 [Puniceicoccaceae bacterium K14]|nr:hypothetical protein [Puniceicoccaceae bacterium K14]